MSYFRRIAPSLKSLTEISLRTPAGSFVGVENIFLHQYFHTDTHFFLIISFMEVLNRSSGLYDLSFVIGLLV